ncbi:MAG: glycogen/starch/alpha-glucan phosphorylase, partial [Candidatus Omnitrophota bacterium]
ILVVTTNLSFTQGNVASCDIATYTVFLHLYYFTLPKVQQLKIFYHELISHIANNDTDENKAMQNTQKAFNRPNLPWLEWIRNIFDSVLIKIWEWVHIVSKYKFLNSLKKSLIKLYRILFSPVFDKKDKFVYTSIVRNRLFALLELKRRQGYRVVLMGLPTSSGKTTWANGIAQANTANFVVIGLDRYFAPRAQRRISGEQYDNDSPDAYNWEQIQRDISVIIRDGRGSINGEYDFEGGIPRDRPEDRFSVELRQDQILLIEGIYALYPRMINIANQALLQRQSQLAHLSQGARLYKICLKASPLLRIVRRTIRDVTERNYSPLQTLTNWLRRDGVRDMEDRFVLPTQQNADLSINTESKFELNLLGRRFQELCIGVNEELEAYFNRDTEFEEKYKLSLAEVGVIIDTLVGLARKPRRFTNNTDSCIIFGLSNNKSQSHHAQKILIFDMDNTLYTSPALYDRYLESAVELIAGPRPELSPDEIRAKIRELSCTAARVRYHKLSPVDFYRSLDERVEPLEYLSSMVGFESEHIEAPFISAAIYELGINLATLESLNSRSTEQVQVYLDSFKERAAGRKNLLEGISALKQAQAISTLHGNLLGDKRTGEGIIIFGHPCAGKSSLSARLVGTKFGYKHIAQDFIYPNSNARLGLIADDIFWFFSIAGRIYAGKPHDSQNHFMCYQQRRSDGYFERVRTCIQGQDRLVEIKEIIYLYTTTVPRDRNECIARIARMSCMSAHEQEGTLFGLSDDCRRAILDSDLGITPVYTGDRDFWRVIRELESKDIVSTEFLDVTDEREDISGNRPSDPACSKSGEELTPEQIAAEISQKQSQIRQLTCAQHQKVLQTLKQLKQALTAINKTDLIPQLEELLADQGKLRAGPFDLFYGAFQRDLYYLDQSILNDPFELFLTLAHDSGALSGATHQDNLLLEEQARASVARIIRAQDREEDTQGYSIDRRWAEDFKKEALRKAVNIVNGREIFILQMEYELSQRFLENFCEYLIKINGCSYEDAVYNTGELAKVLMAGGLGSFKPDLVRGWYKVLEEYWGSIEARKHLHVMGILYARAIKGQGALVPRGAIAGGDLIDIVKGCLTRVKTYAIDLDITINNYYINNVKVESYKNPYSELKEYWLYCPEIFHEAYCGNPDDDFRAVQTLLYRKVVLGFIKDNIKEGNIGRRLLFSTSEVNTTLLIPQVVNDKYRDDSDFVDLLVHHYNHTIVPEGMTCYNGHMFGRLGIAEPFSDCMYFGKVDLVKITGRVSDVITGCSSVHTKILREDIFKEVADKVVEDDLFGNSEGSDIERWQGKGIQELIRKYMRLLGAVDYVDLFEKLDHDPSRKRKFIKEFLAIKRSQKRAFVEALFKGTFGAINITARELKALGVKFIDMPFLTFVRRVVNYKCPDFIINMFCDPAFRESVVRSGAVIFVGGRKFSSFFDEQCGKVQHIYTTDPRMRYHLIFISNHNVFTSWLIQQGTDFGGMLSWAGKEAGPTSFCNALQNGSPSFASPDGVIPERVKPVVRSQDQRITQGTGYLVAYGTECGFGGDRMPDRKSFEEQLGLACSDYRQSDYGILAYNALRVGLTQGDIRNQAKGLLMVWARMIKTKNAAPGIGGADKNSNSKRKMATFVQVSNPCTKSSYPARLIGDIRAPTGDELTNLGLHFEFALNAHGFTSDIVEFVDRTQTGNIADLTTCPGKIAVLKALAVRAPLFLVLNGYDKALVLFLGILIQDIIRHEAREIYASHESAIELSCNYFRASPERLEMFFQALRTFGIALDDDYLDKLQELASPTAGSGEIRFILPALAEVTGTQELPQWTVRRILDPFLGFIFSVVDPVRFGPVMFLEDDLTGIFMQAEP